MHLTWLYGFKLFYRGGIASFGGVDKTAGTKQAVKGFVKGFYHRKQTNSSKLIKEFGLRIDADPCLPNLETPLNVLVGATLT